MKMFNKKHKCDTYLTEKQPNSQLKTVIKIKREAKIESKKDEAILKAGAKQSQLSFQISKASSNNVSARKEESGQCEVIETCSSLPEADSS